MAKYFTKKELDFFRKLLLKKKLSVLNENTKIDLSNSNPGDVVDMATELLEREMNIILTETERNKLKEIEEALERIENKNYGICVDTGELIGTERLKSIPETKRSIKAQEIHDKKNNLQKKANRDYTYNF